MTIIDVLTSPPVVFAVVFIATQILASRVLFGGDDDDLSYGY